MVKGEGLHRKQAPRCWVARGLTEIKHPKENKQLLSSWNNSPRLINLSVRSTIFAESLFPTRKNKQFLLRTFFRRVHLFKDISASQDEENILHILGTFFIF